MGDRIKKELEAILERREMGMREMVRVEVEKVLEECNGWDGRPEPEDGGRSGPGSGRTTAEGYGGGKEKEDGAH